MRQAVANMLTVAEGEGTQAAAPSEGQFSAGINTLRQHTRYERKLEPVPGVEQKNCDFQSLLGGGTQTDLYNLFLYNSVGNQIKAETPGNLGQSDTVVTHYVGGPAKSKPTLRHPKAKAEKSGVSLAFIGLGGWNVRPMGAL